MDSFRKPPVCRREAERRFAEMLDDAGLPRFTSTFHDPIIDELQLCWDHGFTIHVDLSAGDEFAPFDAWERASILGERLPEPEPIHITVPGSPDDPRAVTSLPGVVVHYGPPLHPDDVTVHQGLPVTTVSRTLIDCAECMDAAELRELFTTVRDRGLLDPEALRASRARVEWRPSLAMLDEIITEFCG